MGVELQDGEAPPLGLPRRIRLTLAPIGGAATRVTMVEDFSDGPLLWARSKINDVALHWRNRESLRRLSDLATRRVAQDQRAAQE